MFIFVWYPAQEIGGEIVILSSNIVRKVCVFSLVVLLCALQLSTTMTPSFSTRDLRSGKECSFLNTLSSVAGDSALETSGSERLRNWASVISVILFALRAPEIFDVRKILIPVLASVLAIWNKLIGDELSSLPQADMVSRK